MRTLLLILFALFIAGAVHALIVQSQLDAHQRQLSRLNAVVWGTVDF